MVAPLHAQRQRWPAALKPPGRALLELNPEHPLFPWLVFAMPMSPGMGAVPIILYGPGLVRPDVRSLQATAGQVQWTVTGGGLGVALGSSDRIIHASQSPFSGLQAVSSYVQFLSNTSQNTNSDLIRSDGVWTPLQYATSGYRPAVWPNGSLKLIDAINLSDFGLNVPSDFVVVWDGTTGIVDGYRRNAMTLQPLSKQTTSNSSYKGTLTGSGQLALGGNESGGEVWSGAITNTVHYGRALSAAEAQMLVDDPWSVYRPVQPPAFRSFASAVATFIAASARAAARSRGAAVVSLTTASQARTATISGSRAGAAGAVALAGTATAQARVLTAPNAILKASARLGATPAGRAANTQVAALVARSSARASAQSRAVGIIAAKARSAALSTGTASLSSISFVLATARTMAVATGRAAASTALALAARSTAGARGSAAAQSVIALAAHAAGTAAGRASLSGIAFVWAAARSRAMQQGQAAARVSASVSAVTRASAHGLASGAGLVAVAAKSVAASRGLAMPSTISRVAAAARGGAVSGARAAGNLVSSISTLSYARATGSAGAIGIIAAAARSTSAAASQATLGIIAQLRATARAGAVSAGRAAVFFIPVGTIRAGRRAVARLLARIARPVPKRRIAISSVAPMKVGNLMPFDPIRAGDTDLFQFDMTALFPAGITASSVVVGSKPDEWVLSSPTVVGSVVTLYATAPRMSGYSVLFCTAQDGSGKVLTEEQRILVVP